MGAKATTTMIMAKIEQHQKTRRRLMVAGLVVDCGKQPAQIAVLLNSKESEHATEKEGKTREDDFSRSR